MKQPDGTLRSFSIEHVANTLPQLHCCLVNSTAVNPFTNIRAHEELYPKMCFSALTQAQHNMESSLGASSFTTLTLHR